LSYTAAGDEGDEVTETRYEDMRAILVEELGNVDRQLLEHGVAPDGDAVEVDVDEGFADSAQATTGRSELLALVDQLRGHREHIVTALARIDAGTYGSCERCGGAIAPERLEALPTATLCVPCKQRG